jgi:hypothetical protein
MCYGAYVAGPGKNAGSMPALPAEGDRPAPPRGVFRMNVILKTLHVRIVQECDSTWFTGASSCQRTPVLFVYRSEGES